MLTLVPIKSFRRERNPSVKHARRNETGPLPLGKALAETAEKPKRAKRRR